MSGTKRGRAYAASGVDIEAGDDAVQAIMKHVRSTYGPRVVKLEGGFAGLVSLNYQERLFKRHFRNALLGSCTDSVGSKLNVAFGMGVHNTVGVDAVAMCVNDLVTLGIEPLIFLDYIGINKVQPAQIEQIVAGVAKGCRQCGASLVGGEIAELPDIYRAGEYDLVGFSAGVCEGRRLITGRTITPGDVLIGLPSSGLHSNGYSLARKALGAKTVKGLKRHVEELGCTIGEELLKPTRIYVRSILAALSTYRVKRPVHGIAHITGGGLPGNVIRILPDGCKAAIEKSTWQVPPVFDVIKTEGKIDTSEMYDVFNMGIGMVLAVSEYYADAVARRLTRLGEAPIVIGRIVSGEQSVDLC